MFTSADLLLIEIAGVFFPAVIVTVFAVVFYYRITARYKKVIKRLYNMSFNGVDSERKRIATDMHDHLALHSLTVTSEFDALKKRLDGEDLDSLLKIESLYDLFQYRTHQIVEYMYPKGFVDSDWESSLIQLANHLSMGDVRVTFETFTKDYPKSESLQNTYWVLQEIITNAIRHSKVNRIQLSVSNEDDDFCIFIHYRATPEATAWFYKKAGIKNGMGTLIINDRLEIIGAKLNTQIKDRVLTHLIKIKTENTRP
jgi:signal transduction histidine kinase